MACLEVDVCCLTASVVYMRPHHVRVGAYSNKQVSCGDHDAETEATASGRRKLRTLEELGLSDAEEQIIGKRWNYQQRFDPERLNAQQWMADIYRLPPEVCDR